MARSNIIVVGGGIAGAMTALNLQRRGERVTLIDRWEPGHPRAASTTTESFGRYPVATSSTPAGLVKAEYDGWNFKRKAVKT
jgi:glycine/D-amino acid oxidase-like deaminating enzyme